MKTKQQIFDKVLNHLRTQGKPAIEGNGPACRYLDQATGNSCSVGCLIPNEEYDEIIEGISIEDTSSWLKYEPRDRLPEKYQVLLNILESSDIDVSEEGLEFLRQLQNAHDRSSSFPEKWMESVEYEMSNVAEEHNLEYKEK